MLLSESSFSHANSAAFRAGATTILSSVESPSSFTELGAFSHNKLRNKLIVINNSEFENAESFVNAGPLKAIEEASSKSNIIYYKMSDDGVHRLDSIGDIYMHLYDLLKEPIKGRSTAMTLESFNPALNFNKQSAMFVHDLIYFTGPITHKELIEVTKQIFGDSDFKLKEHLAILGAFGSILRSNDGLYKSLKKGTFYKYKYDVNKLISTFRNYLLKSFPERMYEY